MMRMKNTQRPGLMTRNPLDNVQIVPKFIFHVWSVHVALLRVTYVLSVLGTRVGGTKKGRPGAACFRWFVYFVIFAWVAKSFRNCPNSPDL